MLFTIGISVLLSVIITLCLIYIGIIIYTKRLEKRTKENLKEVNEILNKLALQDKSEDEEYFTGYPDLTDTKQ